MTLITRLLTRWFGTSRPDRYRWLHLGYPQWPTVTQEEQRAAEAIARRLYA